MERGILMNAPMVNATLEGRKTMTRRAVITANITRKAELWEWNNFKAHPNMPNFETWGPKQGITLVEIDSSQIVGLPCLHGKPGDKLWVRETWGVAPCYNSFSPSNIPLSSARHVDYRADEERYWSVHVDKWRPSIHMPRWASRITLEIVGVRVERLQKITPADCMAEGSQNDLPMWRSFALLWNSINGKKYPWESNPFVWVIEFKPT